MTDPSDAERDGWAVLAVPLDSEPPGPIDTEEHNPSPALNASGRMATGPPGGRVFSLEGRPAAGLYLVAWLLCFGGVAVLFLTLSAPPLLVVGTAMLGLGLATAAGYQVVARQSLRPPSAYRGPSPAVLFGVALVVAAVASLGLSLLGLKPTASDTLGFLANLIAVEAAYVLAIWLFVVRTAVFRWREMGWPSGQPPREAVIDALYGAALMIPSLFAIGLIAVLVSQLLGGVQAPNIVPPSRTTADVLLAAMAIIVVAPVGEEMFFRGFALAAWRRDLGARAGLVRSALFFAVIHIVNVQSVDFVTGLRQVLLVLAQIIPLGLVLGWLFVRRGIVASIAGHATYNAVIFVATLLLSNLPNV